MSISITGAALSRLFGFTLTATLLLAVNTAHAAFILTIDDDPNDTAGEARIVITDNLLGDESLDTGVIEYSQDYGFFFVTVTVGVSKPSLAGTPTIMDLNSIDISGSAGSLYSSLTDTDFTGAPSNLVASFGGVTDGSVDFSFLYDNNNAEFGGTAFATSTNNNGAFSDTIVGAAASSGPYSLTINAVVNHAGGTSATSFNAEINNVPLPASAWLFLAALGTLIGARSTR